MNKTMISGLTAAFFLASTIGLSSSSNAESTQAKSQNPEANSASNSSSTSARSSNGVKVGTQQTPSYPAESTASPESSEPRIGNVIKVGEQQTQTPDEAIAKIHAHEYSGRKAATLYVKGIPVLTFVGPQRTASGGIKLGEVQANEVIKVAKAKSGSDVLNSDTTAEQRENSDNSADPVARATAIAARVNQLHREGVNAEQILVSWQPERGNVPEHYVIEANKAKLVAINAETILPDSTKSSEKDAIQAANRLRRLIGGAAPLTEVANKPKRQNEERLSLGPIKISMRMDGMASWYGPGFDGNLSASGEVFNQEAMTAAHKSLPFGTRVQVTNLDNGRSVVVRINDRGPYAGGRVIDLSAAAARLLGLMQSGVAPVRLEILE
jgi:rare lipoprotein A